MATTGAVSPSTGITIKVTVDGMHRKFTLPLRDLTAAAMPDKLRHLLAVREDQDLLLERFSDSAGSFVTLDPQIPSVYKQLHRAAKAKLKLRIKATISKKEADTPESTQAAATETHQDAKKEISVYDDDLDAMTSHWGRSCEGPAIVTPSATTSQATAVAQPVVEQSGTTSVSETKHDSALLENKLQGLTIGTLKPCTIPSFQADTPAPQMPYAGPRLVCGNALNYIARARAEEEMKAEPEPSNPPCIKHLFVDPAPEQQPIPPPIPAKEAINVTSCWKGWDQVEERRAREESQRKPPQAAQDMMKLRQAALQSRIESQSDIIHLPGSSYSVYCNACDASIPNAHYHCSICDNGDFDLCENCVAQGNLCGGVGHWLIKRFVQNGRVINSTTETIAPRKVEAVKEQFMDEKAETVPETTSCIRNLPLTRLPVHLTCNSCIGVFEKTKCVTCTICEDVDYCLECHVAKKHGHHPGHQFKPAEKGALLTPYELQLCLPGGGISHHAICDGCDNSIGGVRYKCLNCPDWDFCSTCIHGSTLTHPGHRFAPVYDPIKQTRFRIQKHNGIFCDGPLCVKKGTETAILGDRYKCAVCHDTDFCANCEASPINRHNKTHPLIKFKTPVRNVSVSTMGEKHTGERLPSMGDVFCGRTRSTATETTKPAPSTNAATQVQIVADLKPSEEVPVKKSTEAERDASVAPSGLDAHFVTDLIADGTKLPQNHVFTQTWTLYNVGPATWPKGCSIKFVGGDNMRNVDPSHPSSLSDLEKSLESNVLPNEVKPTEEHSFSVTLRTPSREGKCISYWRMTSPAGEKFGHKLWCDIDVSKEAKVVPSPTVEDEDVESSKMIFPTLEKESPVSSLHEAATAGKNEGPATVVKKEEHDELEDIDIYSDDSDDDGFNTDEEYDILDASDEGVHEHV